jgi:flagellar motor switch protein FliN
MTPGDMDDASEGAGAAPALAPPSEGAPERAARPARAGAFLGVPIEVTISVGKARPLVSELVELRRDSVLTLDSTIDDPVELYIGDRLIARGELQEIGDDTGRLGVRLTEVADFSHEL